MSAAKKISATQAARSFSDVVAKVRYRGQQFIVEKGGEAVCLITSVSPGGAGRSTLGDLLRVLRDLPVIDDQYRKTVRTAIRKQGKTPRSPWES